jgi:hypothetical protein
MKKGIRTHLTYANVTATLALVLAIGGGTTAIALQGRNTVASDDIRPGNVTGRDLSEIQVVRKLFTLNDASANDIWSGGFFILPCPKGTRIVSGGGGIAPLGLGAGSVTRTDPIGNGWQISAAQDTGQPASIAVTALCLSRKPGRPVTDE